MRASLAKAVRRAFDERFAREVPEFKLSKETRLAPECRLYESHRTERLVFFLVLNIHRTEDAFTFEVAWTKNGKWPEGHVPLPHALEVDSPSGEMRLRIGLLWSAQMDYWWELAPRPSTMGLLPPEGLWEKISNPPPIEEALAKVEPQVSDAMGRIREWALPYFERVAAAQRSS